jgi:thiol-disulfide isomerase/thioredoxin
MSFDSRGKTSTFEKVFVHLADNYVTNGKAKAVYDGETVSKIKAKVDIMRNLLPESSVSELFMIDTIYGRKVLKMGFDTAQTSKGLTDLYNKNAEKLTPLFNTLYSVRAKYTILVFWAIDCDHCKKEIPKLRDNLKELGANVDVKVFAVQTKEEMFDDWRKFIIEQKLNFINVFDPVHLNNIKEKFDIDSTPVIYLLDKDKKIKGKKLSADQVTEIIKNLESIGKS